MNSPGLGPERVRSQAFGKSFFVSGVINKCTFFQEWTQKWPIPGKGFRNGLRNEQLFQFLAQTIVFCLENRAREGGCQGASALGHRDSFAYGRAPFFWTIFWSHLFTQNCNFERKWHPEWTQNDIFWKLFLRRNVKTEKWVWTAPACTDCIWAHPL